METGLYCPHRNHSTKGKSEVYEDEGYVYYVCFVQRIRSLSVPSALRQQGPFGV